MPLKNVLTPLSPSPAFSVDFWAAWFAMLVFSPVVSPWRIAIDESGEKAT
jgi:hypothetical protein